MTEQATIEAVPQAHPIAAWRLVALKDKWDPGNLFRVNQNIEPARL
jgi:hypothetical protein